MVSDLRASVNFLQDIGFLNVLLPFIFVFVVVYGILEKTKVFGLENGKTRKNINAMFAFVVGFIFISFTSQVDSMITFLQILAMVLIFIMGLAYLFAMFKYDLTFLSKKGLFFILLLTFTIIAFAYSMGLLNGLEYSFILDLVFNPLVIVVLFFFGLIWFMTSGSVKTPKPSGSGKKSSSSSSSSNKSSTKKSSSSEPTQYEGAKHVKRMSGEDLEKGNL